ncbi:MAG: hypothetical protein GXO32_07695 [Crenarchaeota archaeon]|nr:hypothetical protein [Thermoproteota archaeon]
MARRRKQRSEVLRGSRAVLDSEFLLSIMDRESEYRENYAALLEMVFLGEVDSIELCPYALLDLVAQLSLGKRRVRGDEGVLGLELGDPRSMSRALARVWRIVQELRRRIALHRYRLMMWLCEEKPSDPRCSDLRARLEAITPRVSIDEMAADAEAAYRLAREAEERSGRRPSIWRAMVAAYAMRISRRASVPTYVVSPDSVYEDMGVPWIDVRELRRRTVALLPTTA